MGYFNSQFLLSVGKPEAFLVCVYVCVYTSLYECEHIYVEGRSQSVSPHFLLFETRSLVLLLHRQADWPVSFLGFSVCSSHLAGLS